MRNDQLIKLGRVASLAMNNEKTYGGTLQSSYNQQGAAKVVASPGFTTFFVERERQIAGSLEHNVETVENILEDARRFPEHPADDEQATLSSLKAQLMVVVGEQRALINFFSGEAETTALMQLFNASPSGDGQAEVGGLSPLEAQEAKHDPVLQIQALSYAGDNSFGNTVYAKFAQAIEIGQKAIVTSETAPSKVIIANARACVPGH